MNQAPLEFVGERPCWQDQRLVEREDAGPAGTGVAHTDEFDGSKDGGQGSGAQTAVRVEHHAVWQLELQSRPHISVMAMLQMGLEEQALDLAAFVACWWDSIWWRGSWRALEDASQDSSSENSTNADFGSTKNKLLLPCSCGNITVRTMPHIPVSKSGSVPLRRMPPCNATRNASWNSDED